MVEESIKATNLQVAMTNVPTTNAYMVLLRMEVVSSSLEQNA